MSLVSATCDCAFFVISIALLTGSLPSLAMKSVKGSRKLASLTLSLLIGITAGPG